MSKQEMVLVIDRTDIEVDLVAPLQIIMPALVLACPFSLYTTLGHQITTENLYDGLVEECRKEGYCSLTDTLREILRQREKRQFRVCVLGGRKVNWDIVLEYKRRKIMIDTVGRQLFLNQVSYTTGGIAKEVDEYNIISQFLTVFSMSSSLRSWFNLQENQKIGFHLQCQVCPEPHLCNGQSMVCGACLAVSCLRSNRDTRSCEKCGSRFDSAPIDSL